MKTWKKVAIGVAGLAVVGIGSSIAYHQATKDIVTVQTGKVAKQDLVSLVTASGQVTPKTYSNVLGEGFGKITEIVVKEGEKVKRGDILLHLESIQPGADVAAQRAGTDSSESAIRSAEANFRSSKADLEQRKADFDRAKLDYERAQQLFKDGLIPKSDFDAKTSAFQSAKASVDSTQARMEQSKAELDRSHSNLQQNEALLTRSKDVLRKTTYTAPIDGLVTFISVRVGENVVPGIQNSPGSYLMTIADMSVVTAEVKVDETDIVNVRPNQEADVTIDAIPGQIFKGHVTLVGNQAVLRTSGLATSQTTASSQEAKDFKVTVTLDNPPQGLRPGLSTTAKIRTAERKNTLAIPLQALAVRTRKDLEEARDEATKKKNSGGGVTLAAAKPAAPGFDPKKEEIQGVFVVRAKHVEFVQVETGITGVTDIELKSGLNDGDEIVTGSYKALRTLKPGAPIKVDNKTPQKDEAEKS
ncbi:MAG: HlyD family efflux transporter periplasmic adaptor subunit [Acidipila sp.]|nr:HlyD family efflux transporter periplasmic adaptor subunit [Acidipila sp.]